MHLGRAVRRPRPTEPDGVYTPAQFDPKSVEMFRLMSAKAADKTTHFYPVAMMTHRLFPPPKTLTPGALGEPRRAIRGSVNIAIGEPIDFDEVTRAVASSTTSRRAVWKTGRCGPGRGGVRAPPCVQLYADLEKDREGPGVAALLCRSAAR